MKGELLHSLKLRFSGIEENRKLSVATYLDPRFKDKFFSNNVIKATIKEMVLEEISKLDTSLEIIPEIEGQTQPKRICPLKVVFYWMCFLKLLLIVVKTCQHLVKWIGT